MPFLEVRAKRRDRFAASSLPAIAALSLSALLPADALRFAPQPGSTWTKDYQVLFGMQLDDFALEINGEDLEAVLGVPEFELDADSHFRFVDEYVEVSGGRPLEFVREYA